MTIQDINCFLKLAETLNYTKTAEALYISQPAVTRHINSLEDELGFQLLDRSIRRNVILTEAGQTYYKALKKCADTYQAALQKITESASQTPLILNMLRGVRFPDSFITATASFMDSNPSFRHFLNFIDAERIDTILSRGEVLICAEEYIPGDKKLRSIPLTKDSVNYCFIASKAHQAFKDTKNPDYQSLLETTLFLPKDLPPVLKEKYLEYIQSELGGLPEEIMYLDSMDSVFSFLRSGRCFSICDYWYSETLSNELSTIPMELDTEYFAVWDPEVMTNQFSHRYFSNLKQITL